MNRGREVIFEHTWIGDIMRVAAIDTASGIEVVIQAPASVSRADLETLALRKLERALERQAGGRGSRRPQGPGTLV